MNNSKKLLGVLFLAVCFTGCQLPGYEEVAVVVLQPDPAKGDITDWTFYKNAGGMNIGTSRHKFRPLTQYLFASHPEIMSRAKFSKGVAKCSRFKAVKKTGVRYKPDNTGQNLRTVNVYAMQVDATFSFSGPGYRKTEKYTHTTDYIDPEIAVFNQAAEQRKAYLACLKQAMTNLKEKRERINIAFWTNLPKGKNKLEKAVDYLAEGKAINALKVVNQYLDKTEEPKHRARLLYNKALIHEALYQLNDAQSAYDMALAIDPADKLTLYGRTRCRAKLDRALKNLEKHYKAAGYEFYLKNR